MFTLTTEELDNAFHAIQHHGYSTMLPQPPEWEVVVSNWLEVRGVIEKIDLDQYAPFQPMKVFAPKNRANVRIMQLLHPQDLVIYTALVLVAKNDIEVSRVPQKSRRVFSYRADIQDGRLLYKTSGMRELYKSKLRVKSNNAGVKFVAMADIADFYPRIYQHRLENVIESVATSQRVRDVARVLVRKLIGNLMGRNSYGIPVGPYASRILAEAMLIDVDASLINQDVDFLRWVDDYSIFCKTEYEAQSILFGLGEWLFTNHGLTLQSAKTKILPVEKFKSDVLFEHDDKLTDRDTVVNMFRSFDSNYGDDGDEDPKEEDVVRALAVLQGADLKGMLESSMEDTSLVDYEAVSFALTKLPRIPGASEKLKREVLDLVIDNAELLYPVAEQIAHYVLSFDNLAANQKRRIAKKLLKPIGSKRRPPPAYYAMWILHVFTSSSDWGYVKDICAIYRDSTSEVIKRQAALAIYSSGSRADALTIKDDYNAASPLLKLSILVASRRLGNDERKHWKLANGVSGGVEKLI